jgi:hypothetical protein
MNAFQKAVGSLFAAAIVGMFLHACGDSGGGGSNAMLFKSVALNGAQENPPVTTAATGVGNISVDEGSGAVTGSFTTFGISGNVAHIHDGAAGVNGGILIELAQGPPGTWTVPGGATLTAAQVDSYKAGTLYVNVHTTANPNGEIRSQIGRQVYFATLTASQETPATTSTATGMGRWTFDPDTRTLAGTVSQIGVTATVAHIHTGAIGVAAPVTIPFTGGPNNWVSPPTVLTEAQAASLASGNFYANVHSAAFPGGEIRGQLYLPAKVANLSGAQETPPNASTATGTGWFMVNPSTRAIAGRMEWSGVTATDAHIHRAAPGVAGGIVIRGTVAPGVLTISSATPLADDLFIAFMQGNLYYNVHSAAFPPGEIRGQLVSGQ